MLKPRLQTSIHWNIGPIWHRDLLLQGALDLCAKCNKNVVVKKVFHFTSLRVIEEQATKEKSPGVIWLLKVPHPQSLGQRILVSHYNYRLWLSGSFFVQVLRGKKTSLWGGDTG